MAKNRIKQRAHLRCGMAKEERLRKEAEQLLDKKNYLGLDDPTPYLAVRNMIRRGELA